MYLKILTLFTLLLRGFSQTVPPPIQGPAACLLTLPQQPLTPTGLSTPFLLEGLLPNQPCTMANLQTTTFVEAVIFEPSTNTISVYQPLVIDKDTTPFITPIIPQLSNQAIISLFFGTNGLSLTLQPLTVIQQSECVNGISQNDIFGQFAYCHVTAFYEAVETSMRAGKLQPPIPPLGKAVDGMDCPTTRSFFIVDQDPSDNLVTTYLLDPATQRVFHDTPTNRLQYPNAIILKNGSDNRLLTLLDTALGCTPYQVPVLNDPQGLYHQASMATNEIHALLHQSSPVALIPKGDPMTRVMTANGPIPSIVKVNSYRKGVHQPQITDLEQASTAFFCVHMLEQLPRLQANKALFSTQLSPDPAAANSLFTFLANRFFQSYGNLRCDAILDVINPVTLVQQNQIVTDATFTIVDPIHLPQTDPYLIPEPTLLPTTLPPTTFPPTTIPPTTIPPTTRPPTTIPPTTVPPTTIEPTTSPTVTQSENKMDTVMISTILYIVLAGIIFLSIVWYKIVPWCRQYWIGPPPEQKPDTVPILLREMDEELGTIKRTASPRTSSPRSKHYHFPRPNRRSEDKK